MSLLKQANKAFSGGDYQKALTLYNEVKSQNRLPSEHLHFNIEMTERKLGIMPGLPALEPIPKLRLTALVITWDVGHNPLGRSYMLAEALERAVSNVVICGFQFDRYGDDVWEPVRNGRLPVIALPGGDFSEWMEVCEKAVKKFKPDVVIACKPRLPSVQLGILFKEKYNIPLIVDVDDHELSFFGGPDPLAISDVCSTPDSELKESSEPYGRLWTRLAHTLTKEYADEIITSNIALSDEFGGTIIPHVRDERSFDPSLYEKSEQRAKHGIPLAAKVVMFFGTPRVHKGIGAIAEAIGKIEDPNTILVVIGQATDKRVVQELESLALGKFISMPNQPFSQIPELMVMADLVVLPQDVDHPISKYQLPAKAIDAIGMNVPLLVSGTKPLLQLVLDGVARLIPHGPLEDVMSEVLSSNPNAEDVLDRRRKFLLNYSYHSAAKSMKLLIERALVNGKKELKGFQSLKEKQRSLFPSRSRGPLVEEGGEDVVIFWKQNDTGLYGRRSDMVIKYLESRKDVRKVVVFDAPISQFDIEKMKNTDALVQSRSVYVKLYEKLLGKLDTKKISYNVFAHKPGLYSNGRLTEGRVPLFEGYSKYIQNVLEVEGVVPSSSVFWFYPKNYLANAIIEYFSPRKVYVDVVDDHRSWPNVSEVEKVKLTEHYKEILARADVAFANCRPVIESMKNFKSDIQLIPNGCEANPEIVEPKNNSMYEEIKIFGGNIIGFVGNLESKIDIQLIERLAKEFSESLIVLVGSIHANPEVRSLEAYKNIRLFGVVPYENVNAIVSIFDVGIVPHKEMQLTNNMNPLKVYVYLANGVQVVCTNIKNIAANDFVLVSANYDEFCFNVRKVLSEKHAKETVRMSISDCTWQARFSNLSF